MGHGEFPNVPPTGTGPVAIWRRLNNSLLARVEAMIRAIKRPIIRSTEQVGPVANAA
jgi:hypothetical protein